MVTYRRHRHFGGTLAGITAVVYFGLVCLVAMCNPAMPTAAGSGEHTHHDQDAAHSPLCAWACQATSSGGLPTAAPEAVSVLVIPADVHPPHDPFSAPVSALLHSRAPPVLPLG
jgi:hypothetical protein